MTPPTSSETTFNDEELDALVERLDNLFAMLEEEGYYTKANTADFARKAITTLRAQLAEVKAELGNANRIMDDWTTLHRVIADIRDASGLGSRPMLSDLAAEIGRSLAAANARADRAEQRVATLEAALAAQIEVDAGIADALAREWWENYKTTTHDHAYSQHREGMSDGADDIAAAIRNQPHDRTALDRMLAEHEVRLREAREQAQRKLAETIRGWRNDVPMTGDECANAILALIDKKHEV